MKKNDFPNAMMTKLSRILSRKGIQNERRMLPSGELLLHVPSSAFKACSCMMITQRDGTFRIAVGEPEADGDSKPIVMCSDAESAVPVVAGFVGKAVSRLLEKSEVFIQSRRRLKKAGAPKGWEPRHIPAGKDAGITGFLGIGPKGNRLVISEVFPGASLPTTDWRFEMTPKVRSAVREEFFRLAKEAACACGFILPRSGSAALSFRSRDHARGLGTILRHSFRLDSETAFRDGNPSATVHVPDKERSIASCEVRATPSGGFTFAVEGDGSAVFRTEDPLKAAKAVSALVHGAVNARLERAGVFKASRKRLDAAGVPKKWTPCYGNGALVIKGGIRPFPDDPFSLPSPAVRVSFPFGPRHADAICVGGVPKEILDALWAELGPFFLAANKAAGLPRKTLTLAQERRYVERAEMACTACPSCGDTRFSAGKFSADGKRKAERRMACLSCGEEWTEIWDLTGIGPAKDDEEPFVDIRKTCNGQACGTR